MEAALIVADRSLVPAEHKDMVVVLHRDLLMAARRDFAVHCKAPVVFPLDPVEAVHRRDLMECHTLNLGRLVALDLDPMP
jgi:hypothetical protein